MIGQYAPLLRWFARQHALSAEDVADVVQLTWLRCLEHIGQLAEPERLRGWLTTICRRECVHLAARNRREVPLADLDAARVDGDAAGESDPCEEVARRDEDDRLRRAVTALPQRQRTVLVEVLGRERQSYIDLSRRLGVPVGSIGPTCQRAVLRLRRDPLLADATLAS
jgi:RNA polymerase sigma factor (sigma-70 family)